MSRGWSVRLGNLFGIESEIQAAARDGLEEGLELVLNVSNRHVPHEEGNLERSGHVTTETTHTGKIQGAVSYNTPYAARQHEDMTYAHDAGRNAKFLENAMNSERDALLRLVAARLSAVIRR